MPQDDMGNRLARLLDPSFVVQPLQTLGATAMDARNMAQRHGLAKTLKHYAGPHLSQGVTNFRDAVIAASNFTDAADVRDYHESAKPMASALMQGDFETAGRHALPAAASMAGIALPFLGGFGGMIKAYHGTPHNFDRFDINKIGTGEGAQAYGHGLYFAEGEGTAKFYRDSLAWKGVKPSDLVTVDGINIKDLPEFNNLPGIIQANITKALRDSGGDVGKAHKAFRETVEAKVRANPSLEVNTRSVFEFGNEFLDNLQGRKVVQGAAPEGNLYKVNIDVDHADLLDWDKPLSEQPKKVQEAYKRIVQPTAAENAETDQLLGELFGGNSAAQREAASTVKAQDPTGVQAYNHMAERLGSQEAASRALNEAGIPGIKYLDATSRGAGKGTSNYVIFDDSLLEIVDK